MTQQRLSVLSDYVGFAVYLYSSYWFFQGKTNTNVVIEELCWLTLISFCPALTCLLVSPCRRIRAGSELTWDYNYEVGSVEGKVLLCCCGSTECRGRLLWSAAVMNFTAFAVAVGNLEEPFQHCNLVFCFVFVVFFKVQYEFHYSCFVAFVLYDKFPCFVS